MKIITKANVIVSVFALLTVLSSTVSATPTTADSGVAGSRLGLERRQSCGDGTWCNDYCVAGGYEYWICTGGYVCLFSSSSAYQVMF
jgi:hypothetical protein